MKRRYWLAVGLGFLLLLGTTISVSLVLEALWPEISQRLPREPDWFAWMASTVVVHLLCGGISGYVATSIAGAAKPRAGTGLAVVASVYVCLSSLNAWGHPDWFFWRWVLGLISIAGIVGGSLVRARRYAEGN